MKQTNLQALIVMAYNVGRAHGDGSAMVADRKRNRPFSPEEGRSAAVEHLSKFFEHIDPGDFALPFFEASPKATT